MESDVANNANSSFCKICAENGFPNVRIYWKHFDKVDGSTVWIPCEDPECNVSHTHMHLKPKPSTETKEPVEDGTSNATVSESLQEPLSESEIVQNLLDVYEVSQRQNHLLKNLLENLGYLQ